MSDKPDCLLRSEFRSLGWEICRRTGYTFDDIYIHWHSVVGEHVVYLDGKFAGYVEGFWQQGHIYLHYDSTPLVRHIQALRRPKRKEGYHEVH